MTVGIEYPKELWAEKNMHGYFDAFPEKQHVPLVRYIRADMSEKPENLRTSEKHAQSLGIIEKKAALEWVKANGMLMPGSICETLISGLSTPNERGGWISVKDRLPSYGQVVIAYDTDAGNLIGQIIDSTFVILLNEQHWSMERITHWMPEPARPEITGGE